MMKVVVTGTRPERRRAQCCYFASRARAIETRKSRSYVRDRTD
jgi:hypothetical protein